MQNLFDPHLRALRHTRSKSKPETFLHDHCAQDVLDRLASINRPFERVAVVGDHLGVLAQALRVQVDILEAANTLAFPAPPYDLIISFLDMHHQNDPLGQLIQMHRALKPDGLCLAAQFGGQTLHELRRAFAIAQEQVEQGVSPRVAPMADIKDMGALLQKAGFRLPVVDSDTLRVSYKTPIHLMQDLRAMGETNILAQQRKKFLRQSTLNALSAIYPMEDDKTITATFEILWLTGWVAHESQQKPLKPGSAQVHLGDYI